MPFNSKLSPLQIPLYERPTTQLKWAFWGFFGEHFMAATRAETFMNVTMFRIHMDKMNKATETKEYVFQTCCYLF